MPSGERGFRFLRMNDRAEKPRTRGITEIRGPYHMPMGTHYLQEVLVTMGAYVHSLRFTGGSFILMPRKSVLELIDLCDGHNVLVSTGGIYRRTF